ncbi:hypothetical protein FNV43_RR19482 [Rhamnella rubrinervis]|uniref:Uncharacterized protein n=1 Tax=Rhamnella rubrinervis TaxID=2594499 RepID=A0A8K0GWA8_9ROSA|nr:hypothetical protein FNV43_RR19482 [Rhamnella rubrinervis]
MVVTSPPSYDALCRKLFHRVCNRDWCDNKESFEFNKDVVTMSALDAQMRRSLNMEYRLCEKVKKAHKEEDIAAIKPEHITGGRVDDLCQSYQLEKFRF